MFFPVKYLVLMAAKKTVAKKRVKEFRTSTELIQWDEFAGFALQALLADREWNPRPDIVSSKAYDYADAMMAERRKRT